jgi:hypothetical protein
LTAPDDAATATAIPILNSGCEIAVIHDAIDGGVRGNMYLLPSGGGTPS